QDRPMLKYGPTVCDGVASRLTSSLHRRGIPAAQDYIESEAQRKFWCCGGPIESGDQTIARGLVRNAVKNRIEFEQRVTWEIHLGHQPCSKGRAEERKVNVLGPPGVVMIAPWIGARADGDEAVAALLVRQSLSPAGEVRIQRSIMLVILVEVTARGIRL